MSQIFKKYYNNCIGWWDLRDGTVTSKASNGTIGTFNGDTKPIQNINNGLQVNRERASWTIPQSISFGDLASWDFGTGDFTIHFIVKSNNLSTSAGNCVCKDTNSGIGNGILIFQNASFWQYWNGSSSITIGTAQTNLMSVTIVRTSNVITGYINGILTYSAGGTDTRTLSNAQPLTFGSASASVYGNSFVGWISFLAGFNRALTSSEIAQLHAETIDLKHVSKVHSHSYFTNNGDTNGVIVELNNEIVNNVCNPVVGTRSASAVGQVVSEYMSLGKSINIPNATSYLSFGTTDIIPNVCSLEMYVKASTTGTYLFSTYSSATYWLTAIIAGNVLQVQTASGAGNSYNYATVYVPDGKWHHLVINRNGNDKANMTVYWDNVLQTGIASGNVGDNAVCNSIGHNTASTTMSIKNFRILNRLQAPQEIDNNYKRFKTVFSTNNRVKVTSTDEGGVVGAYLSDTPFQFGDTAGRWAITTDSIQGVPVKVIKQTALGWNSLYIPTTLLFQNTNVAAFGSWEFWMKKPAGADIRIYLISKNAGGGYSGGNQSYWFGFNSLENCMLVKDTTGLAVKGTGTYTPNTWVKIKITRTIAGIFSIYLDDILMSTTTGSNPVTDTTYTTSNYIMIEGSQNTLWAYSDAEGNKSIFKTTP